jgi:hypothetical protein
MVTCAELPLMIALSFSPGTLELQLVHVVGVCQSPVPVARHVSWAEAKPNAANANERTSAAIISRGGLPW